MAERWPALADDRLERELTALARAIDWPAGPAIADGVRTRLADAPLPARPQRWWSSLRPVRRALVAAAVLALLLAATVAALSLLLPGLRIVALPAGSSLPPVASAQPSAGAPLGSALGLGTAVESGDAAALAGFEPLRPTDPAVGAPEEAYVAVGRVSHVWRASAALPETGAPGVGLVVTQLEGVVDQGWYEKIVQAGGTTVDEVGVGGQQGWWVSGDPHQLVYRDAAGRVIEETRRVVGDVLIWRRDGVTLRVESALGREATIRLAETFERAP